MAQSLGSLPLLWEVWVEQWTPGPAWASPTVAGTWRMNQQVGDSSLPAFQTKKWGGGLPTMKCHVTTLNIPVI